MMKTYFSRYRFLSFLCLTSLCLSSLFLASFCGTVLAQEQAVPQAHGMIPQTRSQIMLSFAPVVERTAPSVVNVYGQKRDRSRNPAMEEFLRRFFSEVPSQPRGQSSLGSGVLIDPSGLVMTNHHVIEGMDAVKVVLNDRREFEAEIALRDPRTDLAVLRITGAGKEESPFPAMAIGDSEVLQVGDLVLAIGNPFGVGQTVTQGIVSALARTQVGVSDYQFFIQTDAAINPGNSGGALVDMQGRLIGINTAIFSRSGGSHGIGFAIPASMVRMVAESARGGGVSVRRPWFGAALQPVTAEIGTSLGLPRPGGALIADIRTASPAQKAGLRRGDVILALNETDIPDPDSFGYRLALQKLGGQVPLTVQRSGQRLIVMVDLQPPPETPARDLVTLSGRSPMQGMHIVNLSPAMAEELQLEVFEGVAILDIQTGSAAARLGFQRGDVFLAINGEAIANTRALEELARSRPRLWEITLGRGGQAITRVFGG
jgi:Do/DeqQ family serine protease